MEETNSLPDPAALPIDVLRMPGGRGVIGMSYCPGRKEAGIDPLESRRDLARDLASIRDWGAQTVVTLLQEHELRLLGVADLGPSVRAVGLHWLHAPIMDLGVPDTAFESAWQQAGSIVHEPLRCGQKVLLHCRAGLGRTGTVAARLLIESGVDPDSALAAVRRARPGAVENLEQIDYIHNLGR